ncbi:MAG: SRPBCC domain-containing protein [Kangiellaceae bacterium]|nr:SRPBCC domain-containing protein [Kangiellaceae bacterium]
MYSIDHRITVETSPKKLHKALTKPEELSQWWTKATFTEKPSPTLNFHFGENHRVDMQVIDSSPNKITWQCSEGPWVGIGQFEWNIAPDERGSVLTFTHSGWESIDDFHRHCNSKWGFFLGVSLKNFLETGTGTPSPNEPNI